jgi:hypothetical protein
MEIQFSETVETTRHFSVVRGSDHRVSGMEFTVYTPGSSAKVTYSSFTHIGGACIGHAHRSESLSDALDAAFRFVESFDAAQRDAATVLS